MNKRIEDFSLEAAEYADMYIENDNTDAWMMYYRDKFAELIVSECTSLLFDESERLYGYSTECDNMRESDEAELVAEKCVDLITMIEEHFGVEE